MSSFAKFGVGGAKAVEQLCTVSEEIFPCKPPFVSGKPEVFEFKPLEQFVERWGVDPETRTDMPVAFGIRIEACNEFCALGIGELLGLA